MFSGVSMFSSHEQHIWDTFDSIQWQIENNLLRQLDAILLSDRLLELIHVQYWMQLTQRYFARRLENHRFY